MADLLPALSSDDDEKDQGDEDDDDDDDDEEVDIVFGGLLGEDGGIASGFLSGPKQGWSYQTALDKLEQENNSSAMNAPARMDLATIIAAKRRTLKKKSIGKNDLEKEVDSGESDESESDDKIKNSLENSSTDDSDSDSDISDDDKEDVVDDSNDNAMEEDILKTRIGEEGEDGDESSNGKDEDDEAQREAQKAEKFFDNQCSIADDPQEIDAFTQLTLSRPLLRGIVAMGYVKPTKIQSSVIPVALASRDICASAVTGSGKTAAFLLPILERLLYRPHGRTKALILTPTRELAAQCVGMISTLSQFTKITYVLVVGGSKNMKAQTSELRNGPQIIVATPGRLLDHVTNSAGVSLEDVEFLVLDEADRLLDLGFQDEVNELIKACPIDRQTLLFSATMNTKVDDLIKLSLKRPVRIRISDKNSLGGKDLEVAPRLEQEFVRVRSGNEGINREAMLVTLLTRTFSKQTIVFFDTKAKAHRMMILCGLCGIQCAELHGNLSQSQRLEALEQFRKSEVEILLATDLAARGLDISRVETVINFEMPNQVETYIHRIGRTARAGRRGKSCTLIGEGRRHLMKEIMKDACEREKVANKNSSTYHSKNAIIRSRSIPAPVIAHFVMKIKSLEQHIEEVLQAEAVARMDRLAEMEVRRAQNIIEHSDEIKSRPQRQWFASEKDKKSAKEAAREKAKMIAEKVGTGTHRMSRKKRRIRDAREYFMNADDDDDNRPEWKSEVSQKQMAREKKRQMDEEQRTKRDRSIHDEDIERSARKQKRRGLDALGDSGLFAEEKIAYAPKKAKGGEERARSSYDFRGYDPEKAGKKKPKMKAHHKFKSKSKYRRR